MKAPTNGTACGMIMAAPASPPTSSAPVGVALALALALVGADMCSEAAIAPAAQVALPLSVLSELWKLTAQLIFPGPL